VSPTRPPDKCFDNSGNRFVDCGNGTVKDSVTGLFWLKNANCIVGQNWAMANIKAAELGHGQCGLTDGSLPGDWRLPTLTCSGTYCNPISTATGEFASIFGPACTTAPYVLNTAGTGCWAEGNPFSGVQSTYFWSATSYAGEPNDAWLVYLNGGFVSTDIKYINLDAWPVRGGP